MTSEASAVSAAGVHVSVGLAGPEIGHVDKHFALRHLLQATLVAVVICCALVVDFDVGTNGNRHA